MPFTLDEEDLVRVRFLMECRGVPINLQLDYFCGLVTGDPTDSEAMMSALRDLVDNEMVALMTDETRINGIWLGRVTAMNVIAGTPDRVDLVFGHQHEFSYLLKPAGTAAGNLLPLQVGAKVRKVSGGGATTFYWMPTELVAAPAGLVETEQRFPGRISWGPLNDGMLTGGEGNHVAITYREGLAGMFDAMKEITLGADPDVTELNMITLSTIKSGVPRATAVPETILAFQVIDGFEVASLVGTQDRRTK